MRLRKVQPKTVAGLWIRALLLGDSAAYRSLAGRMNNGQKGWNDDEAAVIQAACELAMRQFFGQQHTAGDITEFARGIRTRVARTRTPPDQDAMEAVIRAALADSDTVLAGIRRSELLKIRGVVTGAASDGLALDPRAINNLAVRAEVLASERGFRPPLARLAIRALPARSAGSANRL